MTTFDGTAPPSGGTAGRGRAPTVDADHLDQLRAGAPHCLGLAWLAGDPLVVIAASGEPGATPAASDAGAASDAWPSWAAVAKAAPVLLHDGPMATPEVLVRAPAALLLVAAQAGGVAVVAVAATGASPGMALVQARMLAGQLATAAAASTHTRATTAGDTDDHDVPSPPPEDRR
jgi:hypothetical protein